MQALRESLAKKSNEILPITMRFQKGVQTVSAKELRSVKLDKHITRRMAVTND